jgi:thiazole synthase
MTDLYEIAGIHFHSRLWACTAQNFRSGARALPPDVAEQVIRASGTDILITYVPSVREFEAMQDDMCSIAGIQSRFAEGELIELVCTNLSATADEAVEKALRGARATDARLIKLEVLDNFMPIDRDVLVATKQLIDLGHRNVVPFVSCDAEIVEAMTSLGVPALRILASEIGSMRGIDHRETVARICRQSPVPIIVEGGIGEPAHAMEAIQLGATAVLVNSAIVKSTDPVSTAAAFRTAVLEGEMLLRR